MLLSCGNAQLTGRELLGNPNRKTGGQSAAKLLFGEGSTTILETGMKITNRSRACYTGG